MLTSQTYDFSQQTRALQIGILSDTHGEIAESVLQILTGCEIILHAGDVCGQQVLDEIGNIADIVIAVGGNNDGRFSYPQETLPELVQIKLPGGKISLVHGHQFGWAQPSHDDMRNAFADSKTIIYGHSHQQLHDAQTTPWLLNPGAAGHTRTNGGASCAALSIDKNNWKIKLHRA